MGSQRVQWGQERDLRLEEKVEVIRAKERKFKVSYQNIFLGHNDFLIQPPVLLSGQFCQAAHVGQVVLT